MEVQTPADIFEYMVEHRAITRFRKWMSDQGMPIGQVTLQRSIREEGRTPRQRLVLRKQKEFWESILLNSNNNGIECSAE